MALNSTFNLTCIVRGDQPVQINWTKNGVDLGNRNKNTYTVLRATFNHTGWYVCTAVNSGGKAHAEFWIDVTGKYIQLMKQTIKTMVSCQSLNKSNNN